MRALLLLIVLAWSLPAGRLGAATIVCLGDSLTAGLGVDEDQAWPAQLQRLAQADGLDWTVLNAGVSGDTSAGGLRRVAWVAKGRPDWVLVALGANDGLRGQPAAATHDNLAAIASRLRAAGIHVALAGMRLPTNYGEAYRDAFSAVFPTLAREQALPLLPFLLAGVGGVPALNQADGIHPTVAGHAVIARSVHAFLKPLVQAAPAAAPAAAPPASAGGR